MKLASAEKVSSYRDAFGAGCGTVTAWGRYGALRRRALEAVLDQGLEIRGREEWVHGSAGGLVSGPVLPLPQLPDAPAAASQASLAASHRLVFVNGVYAPERSDIGDLPEGVLLQPLSQDGETGYLGAVSVPGRSAFADLNTVFWRDGLRLELAADTVLAKPVELLFVEAVGGEQALVPVRNVVHLGARSRATLVERFAPGVAGVVQQPLTEVICEEGAAFDHIKVIGGDAAGEHFGSSHVTQAADSHYRSWEILSGGSLARREVHLDLAGHGAVCDLNALYMGQGKQRFDLRTRVDHNAPECTTRELYKGVLDDAARAVFDGLIRVARDSQQTNAHQTNRNLLLSDDTVVNSIPRLEIYADDVKCSHGSTTGQLEDEQLFYLRTRGFSPHEARIYLAWAFASEVIESVPLADLREELSAIVTRNLDDGTASLERERD